MRKESDQILLENEGKGTHIHTHSLKATVCGKMGKERESTDGSIDAKNKGGGREAVHA